MCKTGAERLDLNEKGLSSFFQKWFQWYRHKGWTVPAPLRFTTESCVNVHNNWDTFEREKLPILDHVLFYLCFE